MGLQIQKRKNSILLTIVKELDKEDVYQLHSDLGKWLEETAELPKFKGFTQEQIQTAWESSSSKAYREAKEQNDSKNKLAEEMRRCFIDLLESEYVQKELTTYQLNPMTKEVEIKTKKLKDGKKGI